MKKEILSLREKMTAHGIDIYIVPTGDFHGSEYIHDYFKARKYLSGFTGSAGTLVVTAKEARLWTDSRYFLQAAAELDSTGIELMKMDTDGVPSIKEYLEDIMNDMSDSVLGFDGRVVSCTAGREYEEIAEKTGGKIISTLDLVDSVWSDRPELTGNLIWELPLSSAGLPFETKIAQVRNLMAEAGADYHLITTLDDNAWLYNLRGSDVERTPVFFSYTLIAPNDTVLYIFDDVCPSELIPDGVTVKPYMNSEGQLTVMDDLVTIPGGKAILISPLNASYAMAAGIPNDVNLIEEDYIPSTRLKACKNPIEIESTKEAHINDGIAMVKFIYWLKQSIANKDNSDAKKKTDGGYEFITGAPTQNAMTEIGASDYLEAQRAALPGYLDLSFDTISGYMEHGAIVHYSATPETNAELFPEGFLLVDSGGQYMTGTTDITRTIALGPLSQRMKECYTAVLKGHLQLAMAEFEDGTTGKDLDKIAKAPLEAYGITYNHGTGHGVGHVLCVHEDPQRINTKYEGAIIPGMITSDEPGYYPEGEFGVRIENELLCVDLASDRKLYKFVNLTCCPYEQDAIIKEMLTSEELAFLNQYHAWVYESLSNKLDEGIAGWLKSQCEAL